MVVRVFENPILFALRVKKPLSRLISSSITHRILDVKLLEKLACCDDCCNICLYMKYTLNLFLPSLLMLASITAYAQPSDEPSPPIPQYTSIERLPDGSAYYMNPTYLYNGVKYYLNYSGMPQRENFFAPLGFCHLVAGDNSRTIWESNPVFNPDFAYKRMTYDSQTGYLETSTTGDGWAVPQAIHCTNTQEPAQALGNTDQIRVEPNGLVTISSPLTMEIPFTMKISNWYGAPMISDFEKSKILIDLKNSQAYADSNHVDLCKGLGFKKWVSTFVSAEKLLTDSTVEALFYPNGFLLLYRAPQSINKFQLTCAQ